MPYLKVLIMSTHNICLNGEIRKISILLVDLLKAILLNFFTFIDHKSRNTQTDSFEFDFYITCI